MSAVVPNLTNAQFRQLLPEFADTARYNDFAVTNWLTIATTRLDPNRWLEMLQMGTAWYAAHFLSLSARTTAEAQAGGVPGESGGVIASKSVGGVSKSYDTGSVSEADGGFWNQTIYGKMFLNHARQAGMGGTLVGAGFFPTVGASPGFAPGPVVSGGTLVEPWDGLPYDGTPYYGPFTQGS